MIFPLTPSFIYSNSFKEIEAIVSFPYDAISSFFSLLCCATQYSIFVHKCIETTRDGFNRLGK
jgi:hypothetical protein